MTASIVVSGDLYQAAQAHLTGHVEQAGFFLADFDELSRRFLLRQWRAMPPGSFEIQTGYHVTLRDEIRPEIIKWAWDADACLVEAHSHPSCDTARFSPSDLWGLNEWVPHVRWRSGGRPYLAMVVDGNTFDALAWIDASGLPEQVDRLVTDGGDEQAATGLTLKTPTREGNYGWA
jgi:hypothetical protein